MITNTEYQKVVFEFNHTDRDYPKYQTIHQLFEEQVEKTPNQVALIFENTELTYQELNNQSNQLARYLREQYQKQTDHDLTKDTLIALCLDRSPAMIIAILAVLKAGGAYVPIDPNYPNERVSYILRDTNAQVVIMGVAFQQKRQALSIEPKQLIILDNKQVKREIALLPKDNLQPMSQATDLAYIIYTSGTTGNPKGVMVEHRSVINTLVSLYDVYDFSQGKKVTAFTSYTFDVSVSEFFVALTRGAELHLLSDVTRSNPQLISDYVKKYGITYLYLPPALLAVFPRIDYETLVAIIYAGEPCNHETGKYWSEKLKLYNYYGPTEATIYVTGKQIIAGDTNLIGKPIGNIKCYILDENLSPTPIGVTGELYIGGAGLARGYLNQPDLTAERFIASPFASKSDQAKGYHKLYKTGDLVCWHADGNIEYFGRNDLQVKIRGFRIEIGEIENVLSRLRGIRQTVVQARDRQTEFGIYKYLVAYYIRDPQASITQDLIIKHLNQTLPDYMIPSVFVELEKIPLTISGKTDYRALPEPEFVRGDSSVAPRSELEMQVCEIWQEVLGLEQVGMTDDFFRLGGDSILAIQVANRMSRLFGKYFPVAYLFQYKTINNILSVELTGGAINIKKSNLARKKLSFAQERLWFIDQYEQGTTAYNIPISLQLNFDIDLDAIKKSLQAIVQRHHILRSVFKQDNVSGEDYQLVLKTILKINRSTYTTIDDLNRQLTADSNYIFKLDQEIPLKVWLYQPKSKLSNEHNYLLINIHHIAFDGWSQDLFFRELNSFYDHYHQHKKLGLPKISVQYSDYAVWQRSYLTGEILKTQLNYWKEQLSEFAKLQLPTDKVRPSHIDYAGQDFNFTVNLEQTHLLRQLAKESKVTLYNILLSIFNVLLFKYTHQEDIIIGTPIANRHYPDLDNIIGFFVNSLPMRTKIKSTQKVMDLVLQTHNHLIEMQAHQDLPFEKLVEELNIEKDTSRHPIFQVVFGLETFVLPEQKLYRAYTWEQQNSIAKFDLSLLIDDSKEQLFGNFNYATSLFNRDTIARMVKHYLYLIAQISEYFKDQRLTEQTLQNLQVLTKEEYQQLVYTYNQTDRDYPRDKLVHQLFEEQVGKTPNKAAVRFENMKLTYQELNQKSNQLARYLREQYHNKTHEKIKPDTLVVLCVDRSPEMIVAILAVLKAGGAYVPIDPAYPDERIGYILKDTNAYIVITHEHIVERFKRLGYGRRELLVIDSEKTQQKISKLAASNLNQFCQPFNLAYVIYTSGTTGRPKGVMVNHSAVVNLSYSMIDSLKLSENEKCSQYANYIFDASVYEIFPTLLIGASLYVVTEEQQRDLKLLIDFIIANKITKAFFPTAVFKRIIGDLGETSIRLIHVGGEALQGINALPKAELVNQYGPTEATVCCTQAVIADLNLISIGKPLPNTQIYILDASLTPVPIGVIGELFVAGAGLARGYLNQPELTAERFINNPFVTENGRARGFTRLYKTGDLVRWLANGNIEYIGRNDLQVKIRGFRIELGEIENAFLKINGIKQSLVQARDRATEDGKDKYLVAYYIKDHRITITQEEIIKNLSQSLPNYMIPSAFMELDSFPLTISGKLNYQALPDPEFSSQDLYVAPTTEPEQQLCSVWQEMLGVEKIGITDNFFRIGGDSILSILLTSKMKKFGLHFSVKDIFEQRTIRNLLKLSQRKFSPVTIHAEQGILEGEFDLLPIQKWFFEKLKKHRISNPNHWNQSFITKVPVLDINKLRNLIPILVRQHDMLRVRYKKSSDGTYIQGYHAHIDIPEIKILDISKVISPEKRHRILTSWQDNFDIEKGPLWQIGYLCGYEDNTARLFFAFHHLIIDAVSWRILIEDLKSLYYGEALAAKTTSYRQWVKTVDDYILTNKEEQKYWESIQHDQQNYHRYAKAEAQVSVLQIDSETTKELISQANLAYHTEVNDLLLTAFAYTLYEWNKNKINHITLEGHGREYIREDIDLSKTVGWFTTIYPVRLEIKKTLSQSIKSIKENLRVIPNKGSGYGIFTKKELPAISFNYLGQFDSQKGGWQIVGEDSGESMSNNILESHIISVDGMILGGKLAFSIVSRLSKTSTQRLARELKRQIELVTKHCIARVKNDQVENTPSDFECKINQELFNKLQKLAKKEKNAIQEICLANSLQQGFIYHAISQPQDDAYRVQLLFDYLKPLDIECYKQAWLLAIQTYPILRVGFNWEEKIIQIVYQHGNLNFTYYDFSKKEFSRKRIQTKIRQLLEKDRKQGFDLNRPTILRLLLIKHSEKHHTLICTVHHSISDGWSGSILMQKVHAFYRQLLRGTQPQIKEDQTYLKAQKYYQVYQQKVRNYWAKQIKTVEHVNDLNSMLSQPVDLDSIKSIKQAEEEVLQITGDLYRKIRDLAKDLEITINIVVQFAWHKLIQIYTGDEQTIVGATISGRNIPIPEIENSVGLYINTLPLIINWKDQRKTTVAEQLKFIHQVMMDLDDNCYANLAELQKQGQRLFHSLIVFENYPDQKEAHDLSEPKLNWKFKGSFETLDYPIGIIVYENDHGLELKINYARELITRSRVLNLIGQLKLILEQLSKFDNPVSSISLLNKKEYQQLVYTFNQTDRDYPKDKTIHELFAEQVKKTPNKTAVVFANQQLTYQDLNQKSNQLARYLREQYRKQTHQELRPDTLIVLCLSRSLEMIIAILAVLKAGGAYVPIDPAYPSERIDFILKDSAAKIIITQEQWQSRLQSSSERVATIACNAEATLQNLQQLSTRNLELTSRATDLAYVIYTSGTTGKSKGVMIENSSVINLIFNQRKAYKFGSAEKVLLFSSYVFDPSVEQMWISLLAGGQLHVVSSEVLGNAPLLKQYIYLNHITHIHMTPNYLGAIETLRGKSIKRIIVGGERCFAALANRYQDIKFINEYGPTETTITCIQYFSLAKVYQNDLPIGKPLSNTKAYILDQHFGVVPIGVIGELYIGGAGLARGYLNRPELTAERFVNNPFATEADKARGFTRLYKTGDLVRWLSDGNLEYLGRNDFQVKIRGFRIELGEIENALVKLDGIIQAVVQAKEKQGEAGAGANKYLVAYYIKNPQAKITQAIINKHLAQILPEYMIPSAFVELESFPLTVNEKIAYQELPDPEFTHRETYVAPTNAIERKLCKLWQAVLGLKQVGITDDFFKIGGDSILSMVLSFKMQQAQLPFSIKDIFEQRTIANLSKSLVSTRISKTPRRVGKANKTEPYEPYVTFNPSKHVNPLFIFPPGHGGAESYFNNLVPLLDKKYLVLFNNYYLYLLNQFGPSKINHYTYEKLAVKYLTIVRKIQPKGPYNLIGWSFGGALAFEIARQLCAQDEKIGKLILIDVVLDLKHVIKIIKLKHPEFALDKDISYRYCPKNVVLNKEAEITLFKATKLPRFSKAERRRFGIADEETLSKIMLVADYYVNQTHDNGLSSILKRNTVNVIPFASDHFHWISSAAILKKIIAEV